MEVLKRIKGAMAEELKKAQKISKQLKSQHKSGKELKRKLKKASTDEEKVNAIYRHRK